MSIFDKYTENKAVRLPAGETVFIRHLPVIEYIRLHDLDTKTEQGKFDFNCQMMAGMVVDDQGVPILTPENAVKLPVTMFTMLLEACNEHAGLGQVGQKKSDSEPTPS